MAVNKTETKSNTENIPQALKENNEKVTVTIAKDPTNKKDNKKLVGVNGDFILIRKGEDVEVDIKYAKVLENSDEAAEYAEKFISANAK